MSFNAASVTLTTSKGYLGSETPGLCRVRNLVVAREKYLLEDAMELVDIAIQAIAESAASQKTFFLVGYG